MSAQIFEDGRGFGREAGEGLITATYEATSEGFTRLVPSVLTIVCMAISLGLLGLALKALPVGTAYAIWTGVGTIGTALLGIYLFQEPASVARLACTVGLDTWWLRIAFSKP